MKKTVVLLSGGIDSTVLAAKLVSEGREVLAITFDYGQRTINELRCAAYQSEQLEIPQKCVDIHKLKPLFGDSALTDEFQEIPTGEYCYEIMQATVVPNRNMIFLAIAGAYAIREKCDSIAVATRQGVHAVYEDCRKDFTDHLAAAFALCDKNKLTLEAPFMEGKKAEAIQLGQKLNLNWQMTWTCYNNNAMRCGLCGACQKRIAAFKQAKVHDVTAYREMKYVETS